MGNSAGKHQNGLKVHTASTFSTIQNNRGQETRNAGQSDGKRALFSDFLV